jgi:hypothetical protein
MSRVFGGPVHIEFTRSTPIAFTVKGDKGDNVNTPLNDHTLNDDTTIVLLDPTSRDGEAGLELLGDGDRNVTLVVLLTGRASNALREYAIGEGIHLSTAAWTYLDRVTPRLERSARRIEHVVAIGPDTANELATVAAHRDTDRIVLPASTTRLEPTIVDRLGDLSPVPVVVAELATRR